MQSTIQQVRGVAWKEVLIFLELGYPSKSKRLDFQGQDAPRVAIRRAFDETLSVNTAEYKKLRYQERRLAQVADFLCCIELAALRYANHEETSTYLKLFGGPRSFKANQLKQVRRKLHQ